MKQSKVSEAQLAYALRRADTGTAVADVCRQRGSGPVGCRHHGGIGA